MLRGRLFLLQSSRTSVSKACSPREYLRIKIIFCRQVFSLGSRQCAVVETNYRGEADLDPFKYGERGLMLE